jgi:hypothetical protein
LSRAQRSTAMSETTRRASSASDCSLDPAYVAHDVQSSIHRVDWATSQSISPPKKLPDGRVRDLAPVTATPSTEATDERIDREDLFNLDTLEETAKGRSSSVIIIPK